MAPQPCWRCLTRLSIRPPISTSVTSSSAFLPHPQNFSTTPSSLAASAAQRNAPKRGRSALKLTKNKREKNYKVPSVGERRALRKRIVLSNTNALEVSDLEDFSVENAADRDCIGEILQLRGATVDGLRSCQAFRTGQSWGYFRRPATMVREETVGLAKALEGAEEGGCVRGLIVGDRGAGKSILLLQAQALALMRGWVVMTFPDARDLTNATTAYGPLPNSNPTQYIQRDYTAQFLSRLAKTNAPVLSTQPVLNAHPSLPPQFAQVPSLQRLAELGAADKESSWSAFQALWSELMMPNNQLDKETMQRRPRPRVLMALDGIANLACLTRYLSPSMHNIHPLDLTLPRHFVDCLSGATPLANGGAVFAADSAANRPATPALDLAVRQSEDVGTGERPLVDPEDPWKAIDERALVALRNVPVWRVGGLGRDEVKRMLEYYARSGMLRGRVTEGMVTEMWTMSGRGNVKELERASLEGIM